MAHTMDDERVGVIEHASQPADLAAAQAGDEAAFARLTSGLRREIHVHCYRMLGSLDDADDAVQETLLRAWRRIKTFEPRAPFRAWVYRIATNVCLTQLARHDRTEMPLSTVSPMGLEDAVIHLDPYPDRLLDELSVPIPGPEATYERRESVELAFVAAVQLLPPRQRAALLLRDVMGYTAAEVATMLETTVAGINSALQRARTTLDEGRSRAFIARPHLPGERDIERALIRRLVDSWHAVDIAGVVELLTDDALVTMPPEPLHVEGRFAITKFFSEGPPAAAIHRYRLVDSRANGQPALAIYYKPDGDERHHAFGMLVISVQGEKIASLTRFRNPSLVIKAGLPAILPD